MKKIGVLVCMKCAPIDCYLALKPAGHFGLAPLMVFTTLPFTHFSVLTVAFFAIGAAEEDGAAAGVTSFGFSCVSLTLSVGAEKVKFFALRLIHPSFSLTNSEATS